MLWMSQPSHMREKNSLCHLSRHLTSCLRFCRSHSMRINLFCYPCLFIAGVFNQGSVAPWWSATALQGVRDMSLCWSVHHWLFYFYKYTWARRHIYVWIAKSHCPKYWCRPIMQRRNYTYKYYRQNTCAGGGGVAAAVTNMKKKGSGL